jgi:hypothetical protein
MRTGRALEAPADALTFSCEMPPEEIVGTLIHILASPVDLECADKSALGNDATHRRLQSGCYWICFTFFGSKKASAAATNIPIPSALNGIAVL